MFKIRRTIESVVVELLEGLQNGSIILATEPQWSLALAAEQEILRKTGDSALARQVAANLNSRGEFVTVRVASRIVTLALKIWRDDSTPSDDHTWMAKQILHLARLLVSETGYYNPNEFKELVEFSEELFLATDTDLSKQRIELALAVATIGASLADRAFESTRIEWALDSAGTDQDLSESLYALFSREQYRMRVLARMLARTTRRSIRSREEGGTMHA